MRYKLGQCDYKILSAACVVLLTGNTQTTAFMREASDKIKAQQLGDLWTCESLAEFEMRARFPAFFGRWWYTGSADKLTPEDKRAFNRLVKEPLEYGTAVLTGMEFFRYKELTRVAGYSNGIHELSCSFPSTRFLIAHVQSEVSKRGSRISQGAAEQFIWRLGDFYSKYEYYLDRLVAELPDNAKEVRIKDVSETLKGVTGASFEDFLKYLLKPLTVTGGELTRTNKLFKSYRTMIDDGAAATLRKLHKRALQYMEIRRLINEGYIPAGIKFSVDQFAKMLGEKPEEVIEDADKTKSNAFTRWDMLKWSDVKFQRAVSMAKRAPLADWYTIAMLSSKRCSNDEEAERVFFDILMRSRLKPENLIIV